VNQPTAHPHHVSNLLQPVLGGIVTAVADRGLPDAEFKKKAADTWTVIQSFQPRDAIDLVLTGQVVGLNDAFSDALRYLLRGMTETMRLRTQSSLVAMSRLTLAHVKEMEKRGIQPYRTEIAAQKHAAPTATAPEASPEEHPRAASPVPAQNADVAVPPPEPDPPPPEAEQPAEETSWLDEPHQEWLLETPAMLAAESENAPAPDDPAPPEAELPAEETSRLDEPHPEWLLEAPAIITAENETRAGPDDPAPPWPTHPGDGADPAWSTAPPDSDSAYLRRRRLLAAELMASAVAGK
jgi:hypothetical protein